MSALTVPFLAAALLLAVAGFTKVRDPEPTLRAARTSGLRLNEHGVRVFGVAEIVVGLVAFLLGGSVAAALVAASYAGFGLFVTRGLVRGDLDSCGCFSGEESPPSLVHVCVNAFLALSAGAVALADEPGALLAVLGDGSAARTAGLLVLTLVNSAVLYLVIARLPGGTGVPTTGPSRDDAHTPRPVEARL